MDKEIDLKASRYQRSIFLVVSTMLITIWLLFSTASYAATFSVTHENDIIDFDGCSITCSLREAIIAANQSPGLDLINVPANVYFLQIPGILEDAAFSGDLDISDHVIIVGAGRPSPSIGPVGPIGTVGTATIIDAAGIDRIFHVMPGVSVTLENMGIQNGTTTMGMGGGAGVWNMGGNLTVNNVVLSNNRVLADDSGGAIKNRGIGDIPASLFIQDSYINYNCASSGAGIEHLGAMTMIDTTIANNGDLAGCDAIYGGAGIYIQGGTATIERSTIANNTATNNILGSSSGGGIHNWSGQVNMTNSTIALNTATVGGGIRNWGGGFINLVNTTIAGNSAMEGGGVYANNLDWQGYSAVVQLQNTIIAENSASFGPDCVSINDPLGVNAITSLGGNLFGVASPACGVTLLQNDLTGDPGLDWPLIALVFPPPLEGYVVPLLPNSQAIDSGKNSACPTVDQLGLPRPIDGDGDMFAQCDIGAVEFAGIANRTPLPGNDTFETLEDTLLVENVLTNDTDPDGDPLTVSRCDAVSAQGGTVLCNGDGSFTYQPPADYSGVDAFGYTVTDGQLSAQATVSITVLPVNDAPLPGIDTFETLEDTLLVENVLTNDTDPEGDPLTVSRCDAVSAQGGTVLCNGDGSFTYQPPADYSGADAFGYTVTDDQLSAQATASINVLPVNDAPLPGDDIIETLEDTLLVENVLTNDTDPDGDVLTLSRCDAVSAQSGTVLCNGDGSFTYQPPADYSGVDAFGYTVTDGQLSAQATVSINVLPVNDAPLPGIDTFETLEDTLLVDNVLTNDTDPEGDTLTLSRCDAVSAQGGTVSCNGDGSFTYQPPTNYSGADAFGYTVTDGPLPAYATVSINVLPVNDAPVACATIAEVGYAREVNNFDASCTVDVDSTNLTYQWDFGDGNTAVGQIVTHTYKRRQSYTVSVTVFDGELSTSYSSNIDIVRAPKGSKN